MTKRAVVSLFLILSFALSTLSLVEAQSQDVYQLSLQGPTWDHPVINVLIVPSDGEQWWNPSYLNSTLRAINQWNEGISYFASGHSDFVYMSEVRMTPQVSNRTGSGFDAYITWIEQFGNVTCDAGLTKTVYTSSQVITNSSTTFSAYDCRGNILSEVDMQNVAIHELGHCLGLGHANFTDDSMYFAYTLGSSLRAISTLDAYGATTVFRWLRISQDFDIANQGVPTYSVRVPDGPPYEYLPVSQENLPPQSTIDQIRTFLDEFVNIITQPEVMVIVLLAVSAVAFYIIITRVRGKRVVSKAASSTQHQRL